MPSIVSAPASMPDTSARTFTGALGDGTVRRAFSRPVKPALWARPITAGRPPADTT